MVNSKGKISNNMYSKLPNLVLGFHGCKKDTYDSVIYNGEALRPSENQYDWLGNGIYFWENSYERAFEWAEVRYKENACVIGAIIDLGYCLNMTDYGNTKILKYGYKLLEEYNSRIGVPMPQNTMGRSSTDLLLRDLDCAVIQQIHLYNKKMGYKPYDSIRGIFIEGDRIYPGSGFSEKTHTQICIVNPNCIKGYFAPIELNEEYDIP